MRTYAWPVGLARRGSAADLLALGATSGILVAASEEGIACNVYAGICAVVFVAQSSRSLGNTYDW
jgi:hypothetical protein